MVSAAKSTPEQIWIRQLACWLPFGKVLVAIANKHVRQLWAMLAHEESYDADAWLQHPMVQRLAGKHAITVAAWREPRHHESVPRQREAADNGSDPPGENLTNNLDVSRCCG